MELLPGSPRVTVNDKVSKIGHGVDVEICVVEIGLDGADLVPSNGIVISVAGSSSARCLELRKCVLALSEAVLVLELSSNLLSGKPVDNPR